MTGSGSPPVGTEEFGIATLRWLYTPPLNVGGMSVALVSVPPGEVWKPHRHAGYEQFIYVLAGRGRQAQDGIWHNLSPGGSHHLPDDAIHQLVSTGTEPLQLLAVYNPSPVKVTLPSPSRPLPGEDQFPRLRELISVGTLQRIQDGLAEATGLGAIILDEKGEGLTQPSRLPRFCRYMREHAPWCCQDLTHFRPQGGPSFLVCSCGLSFVAYPIRLDGIYLGCIACGFVLIGPPDPTYRRDVAAWARRAGLDEETLVQAYERIPVVLNTPLRSAAESLQMTTNSLLEFAARELRGKLLRKHSDHLARESESIRRLQQELARAQMKLLQATFSPHFLFNCLNTISSLILLGEPHPERMVHALAGFLRYVMDSGDSLVPLREELGCVSDYLAIQGNRFGSSMQVSVDAPDELGDFAVPSMVLQPIVENAITHGLAPRNYQGCISISARQEGEKLSLDVRDDGVGIPGGNLVGAVPHSVGPMLREDGYGLRLVRQKLDLHYGETAEMIIGSRPEEGTRVVIRVPLRRFTSHAGDAEHASD